MLKSYLTIALRLMIGQRGFVLINVSGLTIGIACSLMLFLYIQDELSYDRFHRDANRIYRIGFRGKLQNNEFNSAETGAPPSPCPSKKFKRNRKRDSPSQLAYLSDPFWQGKKLVSTYDSKTGKERELIGVMKDFNFRSLKDPIQPMAIVLGRQPNWEMTIRVKESETNATISLIKDAWKKYAPGAPFEYTFVSENFKSKYKGEQRHWGLCFCRVSSR